jgi:hypothetical protein
VEKFYRHGKEKYAVQAEVLLNDCLKDRVIQQNIQQLDLLVELIDVFTKVRVEIALLLF